MSFLGNILSVQQNRGRTEPGSARAALVLRNGAVVWADKIWDGGDSLAISWRGGIVAFGKSEIDRIDYDAPAEPDYILSSARQIRTVDTLKAFSRGMGRIGSACASAARNCGQVLRPYCEFFQYLRPLVR